MNLTPVLKNLKKYLFNNNDTEKEINGLENILKGELRNSSFAPESKKSENRIIELQSVYDELKDRQEQGLTISDLDKLRINTVKSELEQAIGDSILKSHKAD